MAVKYSLSFDQKWVLGKRGESVLPVDNVRAALEKELPLKVLKASLIQLDFIVTDETLSNAAVQDKVYEALTARFPGEPLGQIVTLTSAAYEETPPASAPVGQGSPTPAKGDVTERIHALIGCEEFKALADECARMAPALVRRNTKEVFTRRSYLFAVNRGHGLTTCLNLFAELLEQLGLFTFAPKRVSEVKPLTPLDKDPFDPVSTVLNGFNSKGVLAIDISDWMTRTQDKEFREFLSILAGAQDRFIFVFRVPFVEQEVLDALSRSLNDQLSVRTVTFLPFDSAELRAFAATSLNGYDYTVEEGAWEIFDARVAEEKSDGRFYGVNTVNKILREMVYQKQLNDVARGADDSVIRKEDVATLSATYAGLQKTGWALLDDFVGIEPIRKRMEEIVIQIEAALRDPSLGSPCIHMRFVGNPGTGKTTVARVFGQILKEKGVLRNGSFFEYGGRDFCGRYVGETAPKTAAMCRDAYGSVLFIDEAYSLYRSDDNGRDYGREAIDTLIAEMENHRSDLVVIMAGYPDEMKLLMKANPGLESRMPYVLEFPNYSRDQLAEIYLRLARKSFSFSPAFEEAVRDYFAALPEDFVTAKEFSNARFVRNLFERTWGKAVMRARLAKEEKVELLPEDLRLAGAESEFAKLSFKPGKTIGFLQ